MNVRISQLGRDWNHAFQDLLHWWLSELRDLGEQVLLRCAPRLITRTVVALDRSGGTVWSVRGKVQEEVVTFVGESCEQWPPELPTLDPARTIEDTRAVIAVAPGLALTHQLIFPDSIERNLERVIALQLERDLPVAREQVVYDWRVTERRKADRKVLVDVVVVHRELIERIQARARAWKLHVTRIGVGTAPGAIVGQLAQNRRARQGLRFDVLERRLAISGALLGLACVGVLSAQWIYERVKIRQAISAIAPPARRAAVLIQRLDAVAAPQRSLAQLMRSPDALDVLVGLTEEIPADSWAYDIDVLAQYPAPPEIKLWAFTPTATMLIDVLRKSGRFEHVRLVQSSSAGLGFGNRLQLTATWMLRDPASRVAVVGTPVARQATHDPG